MYGLPLLGHLRVPPEAGTVPYLFLSGRDDRIVPIDGSLSNQGWYYVTARLAPLRRTLGFLASRWCRAALTRARASRSQAAQAALAFATAHGCEAQMQVATTPFDGGAINFECTEHVQCARGRVLTCLYDGGHAVPAGRVAEGITWWFLSQYVPSSLGSSGRQVSLPATRGGPAANNTATV